MELQLQFGYGMMEHCRHLVSQWGGGTVILSPRDMEPDQLTTFPPRITGLRGGRILFDPQFYSPHADHARLCSHSYWPRDYDTGVFWQGAQLTQLLNNLLDLNHQVGAAEFVLPGLLAAEVDADWIRCQSSILAAARDIDSSLPLRMTIALSAEAVGNQEQVGQLMEAAEEWRAEAYYVVCQHPNERYLVDDPNWLANVLDIVAGLKLSGANVVLGYASHQLLIAGAAKADAIASGSWLNVRLFPPDKFAASYNDEPRNKAVWYYCPQGLSEYKIPFLDIAQRVGVLGQMAPPQELNGGYADVLFSGVQPTTAGFNDPPAFRHYLHALHEQARRVATTSFDDTVSRLQTQLDTAETLLATLHGAGIRGQQRDFSELIDVGRAALATLNHTRGAILRHRWGDLG